MVWRLRIQWHGDGESAHPNPTSLCGKDWQRVVCQGFVHFKDVAEKKNLFAMDLFHCILHPSCLFRRLS